MLELELLDNESELTDDWLELILLSDEYEDKDTSEVILVNDSIEYEESDDSFIVELEFELWLSKIANLAHVIFKSMLFTSCKYK